MRAPEGGAPGQSRVERRRAAKVRRNRVVLAVATVASVGILAAWFPASSLLHQRAQLDAASSQLGRLDRQNAALRHQEKELRTPATLGRIAQQQYDLVAPGDQAYQVLPPSGSGASDGSLSPTSAGATGDGSGGPAGTSGHGGASSSGSGATPETSGSFFGRVLQTLEFWR